MKRSVLLALFAVLGLGIFQANAQYTTGIGIRGTLGPGLTVKHHLSSDVAVEGILSSWYRGWVITGLYEQHYPAFQVTNLRWYIGAGGHVGVWSDRNDNHPWFEDNNGGLVIGLDLIGGLEYTLEDLPLNFSVDWKPAFNLVGYTGFWGSDGALSIRYVF